MSPPLRKNTYLAKSMSIKGKITHLLTLILWSSGQVYHGYCTSTVACCKLSLRRMRWSILRVKHSTEVSSKLMTGGWNIFDIQGFILIARKGSPYVSQCNSMDQHIFRLLIEYRGLCLEVTKKIVITPWKLHLKIASALKSRLKLA